MLNAQSESALMTPPLWVEIGFGIAGLILLAMFWFSHSYGIYWDAVFLYGDCWGTGIGVTS
jgi:hypothetical protein